MSQSDRDQLTELSAFAAEHGQSLMRFAFLLVGGRADEAEDLVQSVLVKLVTVDLSAVEHPRGYARTMLLNEFRGRHRRAETERRALRLVEAEPPSRAVDPTDQLAVLAALRQLTPRQRAVIVLRYYEDLPDTEIAALLGCSRVTVRSLVRRALPTLRALLEAQV